MWTDGRRSLPWALACALIGPLTFALAWVAAPPAPALEYVEVTDDRGQRTLTGTVEVEALDGGMMLKSADGSLHVLEPKSIVSRRSDDKRLEMLDRQGLAQQLLDELPDGFQIHDSTHYLVCYNTTRTYARWCSTLLERLHKAFLAFWKKKGCQVAPPEQPLIVLIFADQASYGEYAKADLGGAVSSVIGYYSIASNRIMMYDLTGMQALRREETNRGSMNDIAALLSLPAAEPLVATVVHEATHQIAFNCGLQKRFADNPIWMSEGMAAYFETPDLSSTRSWTRIGAVNYSRWDRFCEMTSQENAFELERMVSDDKIFRDPQRAVDAYAQAWAWNYFLIQWRPKEYVAFLQAIAAKPLLTQQTPAERLAEFKQHFGDDLPALEGDFYRRMSRLK